MRQVKWASFMINVRNLGLRTIYLLMGRRSRIVWQKLSQSQSEPRPCADWFFICKSNILFGTSINVLNKRSLRIYQRLRWINLRWKNSELKILCTLPTKFASKKFRDLKNDSWGLSVKNKYSKCPKLEIQKPNLSEIWIFHVQISECFLT